MERQCAGCGTVYEDGKEPKGMVTPRPYGCCDTCNGHTFRTHSDPRVLEHAEEPAAVAGEQSAT
jgi:predicted  nucleic acid-binding Zn-ribbon protein